MITNDDVKLSKLSYADSDFAELYPDLLDLAKQLTNKWDPSLSNESDPGVVLLKHAAFIGDHNNYNTDKNTLEAFLPTATQDISVRNIVEMNGYTPRYYISASGNISFNYTGDALDGISTDLAITIPAFTIVVSNEDGSVAYTQVEDLVIKGKNVTAQALFMEGTLQTLQVNNNSKITLENIDNNYRVYFPDPYVAQNGVFVQNAGSKAYEYWERNNYLLTQPKGTKDYKVDFDSSVGLPYIEFPTDIANLIEDGLIVKYLSTQGISGNIAARTLTKVQSPDKYTTASYEFKFDDFEVKNNSSITNGLDPETIDQMYQSFKKVVGTFTTLVTCQDYSNALYMAEDNLSNNYLGNAVVTDIRNDYNNAANLVTKDGYGVWYKNVSLGKAVLSAYNFKYVDTTEEGYTAEPGDVKVEDEELLYYSYDGEWEPLNDLTELDFTSYINGLSPYDLIVRALKPYTINNYSFLAPYNALEKSFEKPSDDIIKTAVGDISEYKCINHNYQYPDDLSQVYIFKEYAPIKCMITPYNKVTKYEQLEIKNNIWLALSNKYNSRMIDWGEPINEEILQNDILNADTRIRSVKLEPIEYIPKAAFLRENSSEFDEKYLYSELDLQTDLVAKNVLAGRLCLFDFDDEFAYEFGQIDATKYDNVKSITTNLEIEPSSSTQSQPVPAYISSITLSSIKTGIYYKTTGITSEQSVTISPNSKAYALRDGSTISFYTKAEDGTNFDLGTYSNSNTVKFNLTNISSKSIILPANTYTLLDIGADAPGIIVERIESIQEGNSDSEPEAVYDYTLGENEYILIKNKNYNPTKIYPANVNYRLESANSVEINPNVFYTLTGDQKLIFIYTDKNDIYHKDIYQAGTTIRTTFKLTKTESSAGFKVNVIDPNAPDQKILCESIPSNGQIAICEPLTTIVNTNDMKCYWIMNNKDNILFAELATEVDLDQNEYFILATKSENQMVIFGSGTRIKRSGEDTSQWATAELTNIDTIQSTGFNSDINWQIKNFNITPIEISEYAITVLGKDSNITLYNTLQSGTINNEWQTYNGKISYIVNGTTTTLESSNNPYEIKTRYDLTLLEGDEQLINTSSDFDDKHSRRTVSIGYGVNDNVSLLEPYLQSNVNLDLLGGIDIDLSAYGDEIKLYNYNLKDPETTPSIVEPIYVDGTYRYQLSEATTATFDFYYETEQLTYDSSTKTYIIPIIITTNNAGDGPHQLINSITVEVSDNTPQGGQGQNVTYNWNIGEYNSGVYDSTMTISTDGLHLLTVQREEQDDSQSDNVLSESVTIKANLQITFSWTVQGEDGETSGTLIIQHPVIINGLNTNLINYTSLGNVLDRIKEIVSHSSSPNTPIYYINEPDNDLAIENDEVLNLFDKNNVANPITIAQIDFEGNGSYIEVVKSMMKE